MPDEQSRPERGKAGPVKVIDTHEQIVRDYLHELEHPSPPKEFDPAQVTQGIDDPIDKLKALAEAKRRSNGRELEDRFVEVASRWAAKNNINREAFAGRIQAVSARNSASFSDGFIYPSVLRGRLLRLAAKRLRSLALWAERSVPLGMY